MTSSGRRLRAFGPFLVGVLELVALVLVARWIGLGWAILVLLSTSVLGLALLRFEGFRAWASLRQAAVDLRSDDAPDGESARTAANARVADTGVRILAGLLLTLPGFVTDLSALVLLVPPIRRSMGRRLSAAAFRTFPGQRPATAQRRRDGRRGPDVIEGEVVNPDTTGDRLDNGT